MEIDKIEKNVDNLGKPKRRHGHAVRKRTIVMVLAVLIVVGSMIASGALVGYLSNTVTTEVTVSSPIEQLVSESYGSGYDAGPITFLDIHGGETVTFYVKTINNADASITGDANNIVTNWDGVTCDDFVSVNVKTSTNGAAWDGPHDLIALNLCTPDGDYKVEFSYGPTPITWAPGQIDITEISATFKGDAYGTYTFTSQVVP